MPFATRFGFVILAHLFVLVKYFFELLKSYQTVLLCLFRSNSDILSKSFRFVKYFFHLFDSVPGSSFVIPQLPVSASFDELLYFIVFAIFCQVLFSRSLSNGERGIWTLAPLLTTYSLSRGAPSASLGISPNKNCSIVLYITRCYAYHCLNISF